MYSPMKVELVDVMGNDLTVANVARVSFNNWKEVIDAKDERLINYLAKHEHTSPFRHTQISIRCKAPIFIARQLGKHQVGMSWNEVSRRYVDTNIEFFQPESWRLRPDASIKQGSGAVHQYSDDIMSGFDGLMTDLLNTYNSLLSEGVAPEQARMILPQNMMTEWVWTGSLMSFFHMCRLRLDGHAQEEAQVFAREVEKILLQTFPISYGALRDNS